MKKTFFLIVVLVLAASLPAAQQTSFQPADSQNALQECIKACENYCAGDEECLSDCGQGCSAALHAGLAPPKTTIKKTTPLQEISKGGTSKLVLTIFASVLVLTGLIGGLYFYKFLAKKIG